MEVVVIKDRQELERLEGIVDHSIKSFIDVGNALTEIRNKKLYEKVRGEASFETYCRKRFGYARSTVYQLIDSAGVIENVRNCGQKLLPETESQARPLTKLEPEQQREAWDKAVKTAPEGKITAAHVTKVVKEMLPPAPPQNPPQPKKCGFAKYFVEIAISQLERITDNDPTREKELDRLINWINKNKKGREKK